MLRSDVGVTTTYRGACSLTSKGKQANGEKGLVLVHKHCSALVWPLLLCVHVCFLFLMTVETRVSCIYIWVWGFFLVATLAGITGVRWVMVIRQVSKLWIALRLWAYLQKYLWGSAQTWAIFSRIKPKHIINLLLEYISMSSFNYYCIVT